MNRIFKTVVLSAAVAATTFATLPAAQAGDRRWRHRHDHDRSGGSDLATAGILGAAAGALIVGLSASRQPAYREPAYREPIYAEPVYREPVYQPRPRPIRDYDLRYASIEPWTREWYDYCSDRFGSFDDRSGTYLGYDGERHFCVAN